MIQPLRAAHRLTFAALVFALPFLFAVAVASRKPIPTPNLAHSMPTTGQTVGEFRFLLNGHRTALSLIHVAGERRDRYVLHWELGEGSLPEALLYWTPSSATETVPANSSLIGSVAIDLPFTLSESFASSGVLVLYDAPHNRILSQLPLGKR